MLTGNGYWKARKDVRELPEEDPRSVVWRQRDNYLILWKDTNAYVMVIVVGEEMRFRGNRKGCAKGYMRTEETTDAMERYEKLP